MATFLRIRIEEKKSPAQVEEFSLNLNTPPETGLVRVRVAYSSLNYKDALAITGKPGLVRSFPATPGIDASGVVEGSGSGRFKEGDPVVITGFGMGTGAVGGYAQVIDLPEAWVQPLPQAMSLRQAMIFGTAGFTAAQSVLALGLHFSHGQGAAVESQPTDQRPLVVTGAGGGVGSFALAFLHSQGYPVLPLTRNPPGLAQRAPLWGGARGESIDLLTGHGPLARGEFSGGIDTLGGEALAGLLASTAPRGGVCSCGLAADDSLTTTVYPFIIRGVQLFGIDSAACPPSLRPEIWKFLESHGSITETMDQLGMVSELKLNELLPLAQSMIEGKTSGRYLVTLDS